MGGLLFILVACFSALGVTDAVDREGGRRGRSLVRVDIFAQEAEENAAKKQRKYGTRSSSTQRSGKGSPKSSNIALMFDKSKLGAEPSRYSDNKKQKELKLKNKSTKPADKIRYISLYGTNIPPHS